MKKTILTTIGMILLLTTIVNANLLVNLTFDQSKGTYNTSFAQNTANGLNFSILNTTYYTTGGFADSGYYQGTTATTFYANNFQTISSDNKSVSAFAWINAGSTKEGNIFAHYDADATKRSWSVEILGGNIKILLSQDGSTAAKSWTTTGLNLNNSAWHHIGFTFNGTNATIYTDNITVPYTNITRTTDTAMTSLRNSTTNVTIFSRQSSGAPSSRFDGGIDEILIYNEYINSTRYNTIYNNYFLPTPPVTATTLYVNQSHPSCSDSYSRIQASSQTTPWCSLYPPIRQELMLCGDTLEIANGTYHATSTQQLIYNYKTCTANLTITATPNNTVKIDRYSNYTTWTPIGGNIYKTTLSGDTDIGNARVIINDNEGAFIYTGTSTTHYTEFKASPYKYSVWTNTSTSPYTLYFKANNTGFTPNVTNIKVLQAFGIQFEYLKFTNNSYLVIKNIQFIDAYSPLRIQKTGTYKNCTTIDINNLYPWSATQIKFPKLKGMKFSRENQLPNEQNK